MEKSEFDERLGWCGVGKQQGNMAANHIGERWRTAFIGYMRHLDAGHGLEHFDEELGGEPAPPEP